MGPRLVGIAPTGSGRHLYRRSSRPRRRLFGRGRRRFSNGRPTRGRSAAARRLMKTNSKAKEKTTPAYIRANLLRNSNIYIPKFLHKISYLLTSAKRQLY